MAVGESALRRWADWGRVAVVLWMVLPLIAGRWSYGATPAGTEVVSVASASWDGGTAVSDPVSFTVAQYADVILDPPAAAASGAPGTSLHYAVHVTNYGNGSDRFVLQLGGEQGWPAAMYRDDNADGVLQATETTTTLVTPALAPLEQFAGVVVVSAPAAASGSECTWLLVSSEADPRVSVAGTYTSTVVAGPAAQFSVAPASGTAPLTVSFHDESTGGPTTWSWDFGDGGSAVAQHPVHQYVSAGSYSVALTVSNANGADTEVKAGAVTVAAPARADFTATPTSGVTPLRVDFYDLSSGGATSWQWDFGDGGRSGKQNPSHLYSKAGRYTVSLTITTATGPVTTTKPGFIVADFRDVSRGSWAYQYIMAANEEGLASGYPDGTYHPEQVVTRDQMATFMARAIAGGDALVPEGPADPSFTDVTASHWAYRYIEYVAARGIAKGFPEGGFSPSRSVDRAQMAAFVSRAIAVRSGGSSLESYEPPAMPTFRDVPTDNWAYPFIEYSAARGIVQGYPDGSYQPTTDCTRDQMAVYLTRAFGAAP
jgi:PKD repeat protein